jgi:endonuclease-3 related protein
MDALSPRLLALFRALNDHFDHEPHWWPVHSDTPQFEIMLGAVLVQQTRWETVEAALGRLRAAGLFTPAALAAADTGALAALIRPCAFHGQKAAGLQAICRTLLERHGGEVGALLAGERAAVRARLLALPRIGRETADTIMLYAGGHPVFIVDAYARRLFARVGLAPGFDVLRAPYDTVQAMVEGAILNATEDWRLERGDWEHAVADLQSLLSNLYRAVHALIVEACIHHCLARTPRCDQPGTHRAFLDPRKCAAHCLDCRGCPLRPHCAAYAGNALQ